eukprot:1507960-Pleurochrysis_carterae.AAC.1
MRAAEQPLVGLVHLEADALDEHRRVQLLAAAGDDDARLAPLHHAQGRAQELVVVREEEEVRRRYRVPVGLELALGPAFGPRRARIVVRLLPARKDDGIARSVALEVGVPATHEVGPIDDLRADGAAPPAEHRRVRRAVLERGAHVLHSKGAHAKHHDARTRALQAVDVAREAAVDLAAEDALAVVGNVARTPEAAVGREDDRVGAQLERARVAPHAAQQPAVGAVILLGHRVHLRVRVRALDQLVPLQRRADVRQHLARVGVVGVGVRPRDQPVGRLGRVDAREGVALVAPGAAGRVGLLEDEQLGLGLVEARGDHQPSQPCADDAHVHRRRQRRRRRRQRRVERGEGGVRRSQPLLLAQDELLGRRPPQKGAALEEARGARLRPQLRAQRLQHRVRERARVAE